MNTKQTKIAVIVALALVCAIGSVHADAPRDGKWWRAQSKERKMLYMEGQVDGAAMFCAANLVAFGTQKDATPESTAKMLLEGASIEEIVVRMDGFYTHEGTDSVPVTELMFRQALVVAKAAVAAKEGAK
jgi:hypothetical protein